MLDLRDDFVATTMFEWEREDGSDALLVSGAIGVEYKPARHLLVALTGSEVSGVALKEPMIEARVLNAHEVSTIAEQLSKLVLMGSPRAWEELADVNVLLGLLHEHRAMPFAGSVVGINAMDPLHAEHAEGQLVPAFLACAGRYDEALRALSEYERPASSDGWSPREYRRFRRQLTRVPDAGGELILPTSPPFWPFGPAVGGRRSRLTLSQALGEELLPQAAAVQAAVKTVHAVSRGKTRNELRALLGQELHERGASTGAETTEALIDVLVTERERFGRIRIALRSLKAFWELLVLWRKPIKEVPETRPRQTENAQRDAVSASANAWLELPDRAGYPIAGSSRRLVAVTLYPTAIPLLDRLWHRGAPGSEQTQRMMLVDVWFTWCAESLTTEPRLNAHIGIECVGQLGSDIAEQLRPAMEAAEERDEYPWTHAYLTTVTDEIRYLLEIKLPEHYKE